MKRCWVTRLDSVGSFWLVWIFPSCAKMFKCARNRGKNGPNLPVTARERALHLGQRSAARAWWARGSR